MNNDNTLIELEKDEYIDETTGLRHCKICGQPREKIMRLYDVVFRPKIMCLCEIEQNSRESEAIRNQERRDEITRLKDTGLQDKSIFGYTFENDLGYNTSKIKKAHTYVDNWSKMKSESMGLLLIGNVGTGKTFIAGCIANALMEKGIPVLMVKSTSLVNNLTGMLPEDRVQFYNNLDRFDLLIIDDFGSERQTDYALEQIYHIVDIWYRSKKPMIVTTNLPLEKLKNPDSITTARIYDRILERCAAMTVNEKNIRRQLYDENMRKAKVLLEQ